MMLIIRGLPPNIKYHELKGVIKKECNINEFILGSLWVDDDGTKNVKVGLANDQEGKVLLERFDGYQLSGHVLRIVPVGKAANEILKQNTFNDTSYQWRSNQQGNNHGNNLMESNQNRSQAWSDRQSHSPWIRNQQITPQQVQPQSNFVYPQSSQSVQQSFYQQRSHAQDKAMNQQGRFPQTKNLQHQNFGHNKNTLINVTPNSIPSQRGNDSRQHVLANVVLTEQHAAIQTIHSGRSLTQGYNNLDKPLSIMKNNFQGSFNVNPQSNQPQQGHYQDQGYSQQWPTHVQQPKTEQFAKSSPQMDKSSFNNKLIHSDKRQGVLQDQVKSVDYKHYEKGGGRFSPQRQERPIRRISPPGHRVSPSGHRILPSGRRISPPPSRVQSTDRRTSPSGRNISPIGRRVSSPGQRISPVGRRISPSHGNSKSGHRIPPSGGRISPGGRRISPGGRRISPGGRRTSPGGRRISPGGRRISPGGRRISPGGRRISPGGPRISPGGRRISPGGRRISPGGRRISPSGRNSPGRRRISPNGRNSLGGRKDSPGRRISPSRRRVSPPTHRISPSRKDFQAGDSHMQRRPSPRRMSPMKPSLSRKMSPSRHSPNRRGNSPRGYTRYSPPRVGKPMDISRQGADNNVRKSYGATSQAQSQPLYSGGYPLNARENAQYPMSASRQTDQRPIWQGRENVYPSSNKPDVDRCDIPRNQKFDAPRGQDYLRTSLNQPETKVHSPNRMSRSPNRRDRSPIRDRYRRQSPSPRSPRRSWALEKRRSPDNEDVPPPPMWPERHEHADKERDNNKHRWEKPYVAKDNLSVARKEERRSHDREDRKYFTSSGRSQWDNKVQKSSSPIKETRDLSPRPPRSDDRYTSKQRESRFSPREEYDLHRSEHQRTRRSREPEPEREDRYRRRDGSNEGFNSMHRTGGEYYVPDARKGSSHSRQEIFNTEIEDLFKRAAELTQKTEEYQRRRSEKGSYFKNSDHYHLKNNRDEGSGPSRHDFYESSKSRFDRNPEHFREVRNTDLSPKIRYKRDKAIDELTGKILLKFGSHLKGKIRNEIEERIKFIIEKIVFDMFGEKEASFIEIVIRFKDEYSVKDMEKIFDRAVSEFPAEIRNMGQRFTSDQSPVPAKIARRRTPSPGIGKDNKTLLEGTSVSDWNLNAMIPSSAMVPQMPLITPIGMMVPVPYTYTEPILESMMPAQSQDGFNLFLYKDNFQVFNDTQATLIKDYIVDKIIKATESGQGWTPDLTLRGVLNKIRYEVWTNDEQSKNWLLNLDFKGFSYFNVLVYTPEELWYERAAIWLPGHSKSNSLQPLVKLKLQNRHMHDVNIDTWKLVKQIITENGTRLYVDIPPSSTRALERNNMTLSYELQKVNVFLKAVAIDKNAFDAGLEKPSITIVPHKQNEAMPAINSQDANIVKICLSNNTVNLSIARKIKDALIKQIYEYIMKGGESRTDFLKYGYCKPGYFCVIPENEETGKWVNNINIGKVNGLDITICVSRPINTKYITMTALLPFEQNLTPKKVLEKLKLSNRGVKGLKFNLWKNGYINPANLNKLCYRIDVDIESVEALVELKFLLDYSVDSRTETIFIKCNISVTKLKEIIDRCKAENSDTLTVTNMEISSSDVSDDDDVVCLN